MLIAFRDFVPQRQRRRLLGMVSDYESLQEVVSRANQWIEQHQIDVLSVETVIMTSLPDEETQNPNIRMDSPGTTSFSTYQIVRVWYRQTSPASVPYTGKTTRLDAE